MEGRNTHVWKESLNEDGSSTRTREEGEGDKKKTYTAKINKKGKKTEETKTEIVGGKKKTTTTKYNPETEKPTEIVYDDGGKITFDENGNPTAYVAPNGETTPLGPNASFCQ